MMMMMIIIIIMAKSPITEEHFWNLTRDFGP